MVKKAVGIAPMALSQAEIELIAEFLSIAADEFSEHSCNDFTIPVLEGNKAIAVAIIRYVADQGEWAQEDSPDEYISRIMAAEEKICTFDNWIASYFSHRCKSLAGTPLSTAELEVLALLLEFAANEHANWSTDGNDGFDFTLEATPENKDFLSAVVKHQGAPGWKEDIKRIKVADEEYTLQDFWVMRYLANRCKNIASTIPAFEPLPENAKKDGAINTLPSIERAGIAPRFPRLNAYLKSYSVVWGNWQIWELVRLQKYASEGLGFVYGKNFDLTEKIYSIGSLLTDMDHCVRMLQWHAIQAAFEIDVVKVAAEKINTAAAMRAFKGEMKSKDYYLAMHYADCLEKNVEDARLISQGLIPQEAYDSEISKMDWLIATALAKEGFLGHDIEKAILTCSPHLAARKQDVKNEYAEQTVTRAFHNSYVLAIVQDKATALQGLESFSKSVGTNWQKPWQRSVAYAYWRTSVKLPRRTINSAVTLAYCLILGWQDWALDIARRIQIEGDFDTPRTQYFVLRLIDDWQGSDVALRRYPKHAFDEPLFNVLIEYWRTPNPADIAPLLLAACDRHTHQTSQTGKNIDFKYEESAWYYPFEILVILKLRQLSGLENPVLDHPLMNTPLGKLPEPAPKYTDALIEGIAAQLRATAVPA